MTAKKARAPGCRNNGRFVVAFILIATLSSIAPPAWADPGLSFIDAHTHLLRNLRRGQGVGDSVSSALSEMNQHGVAMAILSPPPFAPDSRGLYGLQEEQQVARDHPGRFAFTAGGESLNVMIQQTPPDRVTPDVVREFERKAEAIADGGGAGFGELASEHFSSGRGNHPYETTPADHPLFLALADIAAKDNMPIELHMEAIPRDMPFPTDVGPPNPPSVKENIAAFERLLDHNTAARIVWVHAGWDLSGERTVALMHDLLARHANLYMTIKSDRGGRPQNAPLAGDGSGLKPGWIDLLRAFPDRFIIGSDLFFDDPTPRLDNARAIVDALPVDIARAVAVDNVKKIYRLAQDSGSAAPLEREAEPTHEGRRSQDSGGPGSGPRCRNQN